MSVMVLIQPISWFSRELLWDVEKILANMFDGVTFYVSSDVILPPLKAFDWHRQQYYSPRILEYLLEKMKELVMNKQNYLVCLGDIDAYSNGLNFVFGEALIGSNIACVYTRRLNPYFYYRHIVRDYYRIFLMRILKEIIHEWGHLLGLPHCTNRKCVMSFSNSVFEVDEKLPLFCDKCKEKLLKKYNIIQKEYNNELIY